MKKIISLLFVLIAAVTLMPSCEDVETGFDAITKAPDPAATYFLQFINASQSKETGVTEAGTLIDVELPVGAVLMGMPQSQPIVLNLTVDPSTTMTPSMYTLSSTTITIPAGATSGSVTFKTVAANMTPGVTTKLVLTMDAGEHNSPSVTGTKLTYSVKRLEFCPLANGAASLVGSFSGTDVGYDWGAEAPVSANINVTASLSGASLKATGGIGQPFIQQFWGEAVIAGGEFLMTIKGDGNIVIPRQYIYTTTYGGSPYDYEIAGTGKWENCGAKPKLIINYDIYYPGDEEGLAKSYASYLGGKTYLTATITMN